jgi:hypothetical protein
VSWFLCVLLSVQMHRRDCIETFPVESQCWAAAADWTERAKAWTKRSGINLAAAALCLPPAELTGAELNAFKLPTKVPHQ